MNVSYFDNKLVVIITKTLSVMGVLYTDPYLSLRCEARHYIGISNCDDGIAKVLQTNEIKTIRIPTEKEKKMYSVRRAIYSAMHVEDEDT